MASNTVIRPRRGWAPGLGELWEFHELLWVFVWRDIKVRYRQAVLGAAWAVGQPLILVVLFTIFFGHLAGIPSEGVPYPLFALAGLVPWSYFTQTVSKASNSLIDQRQLITKVYFPRLLLPLSPALSAAVDLAIALALLGIMMAGYGLAPGLGILILPGLIALAMLTALAVGIWLSALAALYRDFQNLVPFLLQAWFFATPVVYPGSLLPERWRWTLGLNPMAAVVEGFRWALFEKGPAPSLMLAVSTALVLVSLAGGIAFFRRVEGTMVDVV